MASSIADILSKNRRDEPPEVAIIKDFIQDRFNAAASVSLRDRQIIIAVPSAALAGTLRMHLPELQRLTQTDKRLVIRIG